MRCMVVGGGQSGVETANVKMSMNPFCEIALEEALRLREAGHASEVLVVSMGGAQCSDTLRTALAMGADRAIHVSTSHSLFPLTVAKLLQALATSEKPNILLLGKQVNNMFGSHKPLRIILQESLIFDSVASPCQICCLLCLQILLCNNCDIVYDRLLMMMQIRLARW